MDHPYAPTYHSGVAYYEEEPYFPNETHYPEAPYYPEEVYYEQGSYYYSDGPCNHEQGCFPEESQYPSEPYYNEGYYDHQMRNHHLGDVEYHQEESYAPTSSSHSRIEAMLQEYFQSMKESYNEIIAEIREMKEENLQREKRMEEHKQNDWFLEDNSETDSLVFAHSREEIMEEPETSYQDNKHSPIWYEDEHQECSTSSKVLTEEEEDQLLEEIYERIFKCQEEESTEEQECQTPSPIYPYSGPLRFELVPKKVEEPEPVYIPPPPYVPPILFPQCVKRRSKKETSESLEEKEKLLIVSSELLDQNWEDIREISRLLEETEPQGEEKKVREESVMNLSEPSPLNMEESSIEDDSGTKVTSEEVSVDRVKHSSAGEMVIQDLKAEVRNYLWIESLPKKVMGFPLYGDKTHRDVPYFENPRIVFGWDPGEKFKIMSMNKGSDDNSSIRVRTVQTHAQYVSLEPELDPSTIIYASKVMPGFKPKNVQRINPDLDYDGLPKVKLKVLMSLSFVVTK